MIQLHKWQRWMILLLAVLTALTVLLLPAKAVSVEDFTDVPAGEWYYDAVSFVVEEGLFQGTGGGIFDPNAYMTRGMFITVLGRYAGVSPDEWNAGVVTGSIVNVRTGPGTGYDVITTVKNGARVTLLGKESGWYKIRANGRTGYISGDLLKPAYHTFSDVPHDQYYAGYVAWGYERGIVKGFENNTYFPEANITREEICCLLNRYVKYAGLSLDTSGSGTFSDAADISDWALSDVTAMQKGGIVMGEEDGSGGYIFRPGNNATRAEVATMFQRLSRVSPPATPAPTSTPAPSPEVTPTPTPAPGFPEDTPATVLDSTISVPYDTVRVGLYVSTKSLNSCKSSVTLKNVSGDTFEHGYFDNSRHFVPEGTIDADTITVTMDGTDYTIRDASGNVVESGSGNVSLRPIAQDKALTQINSGYRYYGAFALRQAYNRPGYITLVNYVDIEDYVKGVLPYEFYPSWPSETLKAAAIAVRSYVYKAQWGTYADFGFDIRNDTSAQVYYGRHDGSKSASFFTATDKAVEDTEGLYLTYSSGGQRKLCTPYFSSSNGGASEDSANIWGGNYSYLIGKIDPYEGAAGSEAPNYNYSITQSRTGSKLSSMARSLGLDTIAKNGIRVESYSDTGNVYRVVITDINGRTATYSGANGRWDFLGDFGFTCYSYRYYITYNESADTFTCTRWGWGHNVGLSQWGAYAMAKYYGKDHQDILGFYFDGTNLQYGAYEH